MSQAVRLTHLLKLLLLSISVLSFAQASGEACKFTPDSPQWPSATDWAAFNQSTGGRLLRPHSPAAACHTNQPEYNSAECSRITSSWSSSQWHSDNPLSNDWQNWNNYSCLP